MVFDNLEVRHKAFGAGIVREKQGRYLTVEFGSAVKKFVYPDVFDSFLTLSDGTVPEEVRADIAETKKQKQSILDKKNEENLRAMTRGIVIPGKEAVQENEEEERRFKEAEEI